LEISVNQAGIDRGPLRLERHAQRKVPSLQCGGLHLVECCLTWPGRESDGWKVESREFRHVVRVGIIQAADKDTDAVHGGSFRAKPVRAMIPAATPQV